MGTAPAFASVTEAIDMARAALGYLAAAADAALPGQTQAECLQGLEPQPTRPCRVGTRPAGEQPRKQHRMTPASKTGAAASSGAARVL